MSEYYGNNDWRDYIAHYGVKGMKWRNHKYLKKIGDFYEYNVTGQGYLKDADRYSARSRSAQARADRASNTKSYSAWDRMYMNRQIQERNARKARDSYNAYLTKSLSGKLSKNIPASGGWRPVKGGGSDTVYGGYDPNKSKYSNLSEMNAKKKELKKRQRKEKAKALVNKILGKSYNSSPATAKQTKNTNPISNAAKTSTSLLKSLNFNVKRDYGVPKEIRYMSYKKYKKKR